MTRMKHVRPIEYKNVLLYVPGSNRYSGMLHNKVRGSETDVNPGNKLIISKNISKNDCFQDHPKHHWFSGKIQRCHRWAPCSIHGWCRLFNHFLLKIIILDAGTILLLFTFIFVTISIWKWFQIR